MKKFLLFLSVLVVFSGCGANKPVVDFKFKSGISGAKIIQSNDLHLSAVDIKRHKLQDTQSRILFYEEVKIGEDYDFAYNPLNSIIYIFNAKKATLLYDDNKVLLAQIELATGESINIFANSTGVDYLSYVYGFSNHEFKKIAREIAEGSNKRLPSLTKQGITLGRDDMDLSRWSEAKLLVNPFVAYSKGRTIF